MSIKNLFTDFRNSSRNYQDYTTEKEFFKEIESITNATALQIKVDTFVPQLDYSKPENFIQFGSAELFYDAALTRIIDYYPYDGSEAEKTNFYNKLYEGEKYIFDNLYPRFTGYATIAANGWGTTTITDGYGLPSTLEHITFKGGPHSTSNTEDLKTLTNNPSNNKYQSANIYEENPYTPAGLPSDYGDGSRQSNLQADFDTGVTVEFWLKTGSIDKTLTEKQVVFDWWNQETASANNYGRILVELTSSKDDSGNALRPFLVTVMSGSTTTRNFISLGTDLHGGLSDWKHYSISIANSGSAFNTKLYVNGKIDDAVERNYDLKRKMRSHNSSLVSTEYTSTNNLQGWWRLNAIGDQPDSSGNNRNGTPVGSPTYNSSNTPNKYIATATHTFDGTDDQLNIGTAALWDSVIGPTTSGGTAKFTLSAWIRPHSLGDISAGRIFDFGSSDIAFYIGAGSADYELRFRTKWDGAVTARWDCDSMAGNFNEWVHVAVTYDATDYTTGVAPVIYLNGESQAVTQKSTIPAGDWAGIAGNPCFIGSANASSFFDGEIADAAVWDSILTEEEIKSIYSAVVMPNKSGADIAPLNTKNAIGRIGALQTTPVGLGAAAGSGKLSGSIDEFRYWKEKRDAREVARNYFVPINGGTNTDISNTTLGVYYKFNEGITGTEAIDSTVLDYSGRISNGVWTGYAASSRNTGSAIVSASAALTEYKEPVIYSVHPEYVALKENLRLTGSAFDGNNNNAFVNYMPAWILDQHDDTENKNLRIISNIVGTYFDKMSYLSSELPKLKHSTYTSASHRPLPFASHLPTSLGLYTPELFVDSTIVEKLKDRDNSSLFENSLHDTKNLIYLNLYNNLTNIYKSKGTEKSIKNVMRCFYLDDQLIKLKKYNVNATYDIGNNYEQQIVQKRAINLNTGSNLGSVIYQRKDSSNPQSSGFITGTIDSAAAVGDEQTYGFTLESDIIFPNFFPRYDTFNRNYKNVSLFGLHSVTASSSENLDGSNTTFLATDHANFQVLAIRDKEYSKNVYFKLTSSYSPYPLPTLTSSDFPNVYDGTKWNISVRVEPAWDDVRYLDARTSGDYKVIFRGVNDVLGTTKHSFELSGTISNTIGSNFLRSLKRVYVGAQRTNLTGTLINKSDVMYLNCRAWLKSLDNHSIDSHNYGRENSGITDVQEYLSPYEAGYDVTNRNTLALDWTFNNITSSDGTGNFIVQDVSSGSALIRNNYSWLGKFAGYQHTGYGHHFEASSEKVVKDERLNSFVIVDPEQVVSSDMINILSKDDEIIGNDQTVPSYLFTIEKSMYDAVSSEMLTFFAGAVDFNNLIGNPVNRYRERYKDMEKLRAAFFQRVTKTSDVEKFIEYYKWFDDALTKVLNQLLPASADGLDKMLNVVESHVLERNKYKTPFPTLEQKVPDPDAGIHGRVESDYPYAVGFSPPPRSPRDTRIRSEYWKRRAERTASDISSGDATVDIQREIYRRVINSNPYLNSTLPVLYNVDDESVYTLDAYSRRNFIKTQVYDAKQVKVYKGGSNFEPNKNISFALSSVAPAGPVAVSGTFVPLNVLLSLMSDLIEVPTNDDPDPVLNVKKKRHFFVRSGRDYEEGLGYKNLKSTMAFPFSLYETDVTSGYQAQLVNRLSGTNIEITNLHNDVYGKDFEKPMQGPFTEYAVGGHQSRHVRLNYSSSTRQLDTPLTRPEAWRILIGSCYEEGASGPEYSEPSGAIGLVGPDYPDPATALSGTEAYPYRPYQKAVYYRDMVAKRPVNIRNIQMKTGSTVLGNYTDTYEYVQTVGAFQNPRHFVDNQPELPSRAFQNTATASTSIRTFLDTHRTGSSHVESLPAYSVGYLTGAMNKSVFISRFSSPGSIETMTRGYQDFRSSEFSVYNALNYRNLSVKKPWQGPAASVSEATINGDTTNIKVSDIHSLDYGLTSHLSRHTARFGRDSLIFPPRHRRTYDLAKAFVGYSDKKIYRASDHLQGWWRLNYPMASGDIPDDSGRGNVGTFSSDARRPTYEASSDPGIIGATSGSAQFDPTGTQDAINIGLGTTWDAIIGNAGGSTRKMTFAAWVYKAGDGGDGEGRIIQFGGADILFLRTTASERLYLFTDWTTNGQYYTGTGAISLNKWHHVVVTYDANDASNLPVFYVDGQVVANDPSFGSYQVAAGTYKGIRNSSDAASNCVIGNTPAMDKGWEGHLADVAVWNRVLEAEEIQAIYSATKSESSYGPGTSYTELPGFHKVHRNNLKRVVSSSTGVPQVDNQYDNYFVQHQIPRSSKQYAWITASLQSDNGWCGYLPSRYVVRNKDLGIPGEGFTEPYSFVSQSDFGSYLASSRRFGISQHAFDTTAHRHQFMPTVPTVHTNLYEPFTASTNTIGYPLSVPLVVNSNSELQYLNRADNFADFVDAGTRPGNYNVATAFNALMWHRGNQYGFPSWKQLRQADNPIVRNERASSTISVIDKNGNDDNITTYNLPPVSNRGRPNFINFDTETGQNITVKATGENENVYFNSPKMDNVYAPNLSSFSTPSNHMIQVGRSKGHALNWIIYKQQLFPSIRNEFVSHSTNKVTYDNLFWRDDRHARSLINTTLNDNTFPGAPEGAYYATNSFGYYVSRSAWPLDAPEDFLTRLGPPEATSINNLQQGPTTFSSGAAGELQNSYTYFVGLSPAARGSFTGSIYPIDANFDRYLFNNIVQETIKARRVGPIYARPHALSNRFSVRSPYGPTIPGIPGLSSSAFSFDMFKELAYTGSSRTGDIPIGAGQCMWEADKQAGYVDISTIKNDTYDLNKPFTRHYGVAAGYESHANLVGWWRALEDVSTAGNVPDSSGNGKTGSFDDPAERPAYENLAFLGVSPYIQTSSYFYEPAAASSINIGTGAEWDDIIGNDTANGSTQKMTLAAWVYKVGPGGEDGATNAFADIINFGSSSIGFGSSNTVTRGEETLHFSARWSSTVNASLTNCAVWYTNPGNYTGHTLREWNHVAVTYDATSTENNPKFYVNGELVETRSRAFAPAGTFSGISSVDCYIGNASTKQRAFEGNIAEVGVWNSILKPSEIKALFKASEKSEGFVSSPSKPWFNSYEDYRYDLKLMAKGYSVIPEYRISNNVKDYLSNESVDDPFQGLKLEIPHVEGADSSNDGSFFISYSNSEFLRDFLSIKRESLLNAKEIRLSVTGAIRFNPYKGFYPAQRTIDLAEQFLDSYKQNIVTTHTVSDPTGETERFINSPTDDLEGIFNQRGIGDYSQQATLRPIMQPLFSPGIMYNSIKSGMAVDYPIMVNRVAAAGVAGGSLRMSFSGSGVEADESQMPSGSWINSLPGQNGLGEGFGTRLPFETLLEPLKHLGGIDFFDGEACPLTALTKSAAASFVPIGSDNVYEHMSRNFFGAVPSFFLRNRKFTSIKSDIRTDTISFKGDEVFMMRIKMNRSTAGNRHYLNEIGSNGSASYPGDHYTSDPGPAYTLAGARAKNIRVTNGPYNEYYPIPQDPIYANKGMPMNEKHNMFRESFTMYSRPTAFGPPHAGHGGTFYYTQRDRSDPLNRQELSLITGTIDSYNGFNPAYTPPYTNGEAWCDVVFRPEANKNYSLSEIVAESKVAYWRFDAGDTKSGLGNIAATSLIPSFNGNKAGYYELTTLKGTSVVYTNQQIDNFYDGIAINDSSMQLSGCLNLFGIEKVDFSETDTFGNPTSYRPGQSIGERWVIKPKFETPMMNFNDASVTYPENYGIESVAKGMWHQFGEIPKKEEGVYISVQDIPRKWLKNHYAVVSSGSIYNNVLPNSGTMSGSNVFRKVKSLADLVGFNKDTKAKLGLLKPKTTLREAIVAIPYITERTTEQGMNAGPRAAKSKKFISIPEERYQAALKENYDTAKGRSFQAAGSSVSRQLQKMQRYVLPPQFDFVNNKQNAVEPFVMYIFEFKYDLDRNDLSYIWQNLAPRDYQKISFQKQSIAHELLDAEVLSEQVLEDNQNLRWMIFKVKQKGQEDYWDYIDEQVNVQPTTTTNKRLLLQKEYQNNTNNSSDYKLRYNWPYDFVSFVELAKMNVEIKYSKETINVQQALNPTPQAQVMSAPAAVSPQLTSSPIVTNMQVVPRNTFSTPSKADFAVPTAAQPALGFVKVKRATAPAVRRSTNTTTTMPSSRTRTQVSQPTGVTFGIVPASLRMGPGGNY